jgi:uncharacterized protein (DUF58 family)
VFSKFTINSLVFIALTVFTVIVAAIFKNPLLVYTAVFLVVTNGVLFVWAQLSVAGMEVRRRHPRLAVATKPVEVDIELVNRRRTARYGTLGFDLHQDLTPSTEYTPVAFLDAQPGVKTISTYQMIPARRGVFSIGPFYLYSGDPFGFYKCWARRKEFSELVVLPCPVPFSFRRPVSRSMLSQDEMETVPVSGNSTEFMGVREYVEGEPLKRVHWRTSARLGKLISRQYEMNVAAAVSALTIVDKDMLRGTTVDNPLEYTLTMVASLGYATLSERFQFSHLALLGDEHSSQSGTGRAFYEELAVSLAKIDGYGEMDWDNRGRMILNYLPPGSSLIVFTVGLDEIARTRIRQLAAQYSSVVVVTFNRESFDQARQPEKPGPRIVLGEGYLVLEVFYQDNLARVLEQALGSAGTPGGGR